MSQQLEINSIRWLVALAIFFQKVIVRYFSNSFGIINNVYVRYFDTSYIAVDWFTVIQHPGSVLANFIAAWLIYTNKVGLRRLSIMTGIGCIITSSCMLTASFFPTFYPLIYLGQFIMGLSYSTLLIMSIQMANKWFPCHEVGKALAIFPLGSSLASALVILIPSNTFNTVVVFHNRSLNNTENFTDLLDADKKLFTIYNSCLFAVTLMAIVPVIVVVQDQPPAPPTEAQALLRSTSCFSSSEASVKMKTFLRECRRVLTNNVILIISILITIRFAWISIQTMFLSEILRPINSNTDSKSNVWSGYISTTFEVTSALGHIMSSFIFDRFKKHIYQMRLSFFSVFVFMLGLCLAVVYKNVTLVCLFNSFWGIPSAFSMAPLYDTAVQHLYPTKSGFVSSLTLLLSFSALVIVVQLQRLLLLFAAKWSALLFTSLLVFAAFCLTFFLKPEFKILNLNM